MGTFQCGDDAFEPGQFVGGADGFIVVDGEDDGTFLLGKVGVHGADARIVQSGRDGIGLFYLSVLVLDDVGARAVDDAHLAEGDGGGCHSRFNAFSSGFGEDDLHVRVVDVVIDGAGCIASSAYAGDEVVGAFASLVFKELLPYFFADDRLQACHHVGVRMRADGGPYHVVGVRRMAAPVADGFVGGVLQRHIATGDGNDGGAEHLHLLHIDALALYVGLTHVDDAFHVHQGADGGCGHTVLSGSGFGDDAALAHAACQQHLPDAVVDFVGTGVVQVFTLEVNPATVLLGQAVCQVEWGRASHVVAQQLVVFTLEVLTLQHLEVGVLQLFYTFVEDFGNVCPAELSVITFFVN